mmetsp:Transcript_19134/g.29601  ORF Transcript_19134/g.29601 Transcript_19134/m.29601 type:complete len:205 (+) Transcript_19134:556-1170(+)
MMDNKPNEVMKPRGGLPLILCALQKLFLSNPKPSSSPPIEYNFDSKTAIRSASSGGSEDTTTEVLSSKTKCTSSIPFAFSDSKSIRLQISSSKSLSRIHHPSRTSLIFSPLFIHDKYSPLSSLFFNIVAFGFVSPSLATTSSSTDPKCSKTFASGHTPFQSSEKMSKMVAAMVLIFFFPLLFLPPSRLCFLARTIILYAHHTDR